MNRLTRVIGWLDRHQGLAGWAQFVGSAIALGLTVTLYYSSTNEADRQSARAVAAFSKLMGSTIDEHLVSIRARNYEPNGNSEAVKVTDLFMIGQAITLDKVAESELEDMMALRVLTVDLSVLRQELLTAVMNSRQNQGAPVDWPGFEKRFLTVRERWSAVQGNIARR